ncbi:MAG: ComEC/Rec2 family competence protein [Motilibacteraceae bacterium]
MTPPGPAAAGATGPGDGRARPLDLRLAAPATAAWAAAWLALAQPPGRVVLLVALLAGVLAAALVGVSVLRVPRRGTSASASAARGRRLRVGVGCAVCALGAALSAAAHVVTAEGGAVGRLAAERAQVRAQVVLATDPHPFRSVGPSGPRPGWTVRGHVVVLDGRGRAWRGRVPVVLLARDPRWSGLLPGTRLLVPGRLSSPRPGDDAAALLAADGPPQVLERPGAVGRAAGRLRAGLREAVAGAGPAERGLVPGLVVGDDGALPADVADAMRQVGLSHLTAVSGANVAIVVGAVLLVARWTGVPVRLRPAAAVLALAGFVVLARPEPSVLRAAVMGLVAVAGLAGGRRGAGLPALAGAALLLVLLDPALARSYGFVLSAVATAGLLLLAGPWSRALAGPAVRAVDLVARRRPSGGDPGRADRVVPLARRAAGGLALALAVPAAAQAVCGPITVLLSPRVSLVAVPANLLVAPAVAPATLLGVLAALVSPLSSPLAAVLGRLAAVPAWWIVHVALTAAALPAASLPWLAGVAGAVALAAVTLVAVLAAGPVARAAGRLAARRPAAAALAAAVTLLALLLVLLPAHLSPRWPPAGWVLAACDVGQGDALVLPTEPGAAVVVDTGPDPAAVDRCLRRLRVRRVDRVVLTHDHADHAEGLPGVLRGRPVGEVVVGPLDEPAQEAERVTAWTRAAHVPIRRARVGEQLGAGPLSLVVLAPPAPIPEDSAPNNSSLVLLAVRAGVRSLLTGDVEPPAQAALLRTLDADGDGRLDAGPVDVLKVPHHGSVHQLPALLAETGARLAVISVGADNDYGHPAPATVDLLRADGARVLRTDQDGTVLVLGPEGHLAVATGR